VPFKLKSITVPPPFYNEVHMDKDDCHTGSNTVIVGMVEALQQELQQQQQQQAGKKQQEGEQQQQQHMDDPVAAVAAHLCDPTSAVNDASHSNGAIIWYHRGEGELLGGTFVEKRIFARTGKEGEEKEELVLGIKPVHGMVRAFDTTKMSHCSGESGGRKGREKEAGKKRRERRRGVWCKEAMASCAYVGHSSSWELLQWSSLASLFLQVHT
jgi:hypothetical protein